MQKGYIKGTWSSNFKDPLDPRNPEVPLDIACYRLRCEYMMNTPQWAVRLKEQMALDRLLRTREEARYGIMLSGEVYAGVVIPGRIVSTNIEELPNLSEFARSN